MASGLLSICLLYTSPVAYYFDEPSRTFNEYLLVPGHTPSDCIPAAVSLKTPLVKYRKGKEECPLTLNVPMVSAIMAVSYTHLDVYKRQDYG